MSVNTGPGTPVPAELPRVSAIVLAWKAEPWLRRSVEALLGSEKVDVDVVLVDNGCTTNDVVELGQLPKVTVTGSGTNVGYSAGCNVGVAASSGTYVALINGDAVVDPGCLARLLQELGKPDVGIAAGSVRLAEDPALLNSRGNVVHVLGMSWVGGFGEREVRTEPSDTAGAMGACLVTTREHWDRLGGFDPEYFAYHEDAEVSIRTWRMGLRVVNVPDAVVVHRYEFSRNSFKFYLVERNRLMFVLTLWGRRSLLLLGGPLVALELGMLALAAKDGWLPDKLRGYRWLWQHRVHLRERRRALHRERTVSDRQWMRVLSDQLDTPLISVPGRGVLNRIMAAYWSLVYRWV